ESGSAPVAGSLRGREHPAMKTRRLAILVAMFTLAAATGFSLWRVSSTRAARTLATSPVRKGEFPVLVRCRGELRARKTLLISAAHVPDLRIVLLAAAGTLVKEGEPGI